jgi:Flp pilus assembly protein TadG
MWIPRPIRTLLGKTAQGDSERGEATVEMVIVFPVALVIFFGIIQGAIWFNSGNVAQAAAAVAYNEARTYNGSDSDGVTAGTKFLQANSGSLSGPAVSVTRTATTVTVTVTGTSISIIPGLGTNITRTVSGPTERWVN